MVTVFNSPPKKWSTIERALGIVGSIASIIGFFYLFIPGQRQPSSGSHSPIEPQLSQKEKSQNPPDLVLSKKSRKLGLDGGQKLIPLSNATAVLIVENENAIDWTLSSMIASELKNRGVMITKPSVFNNSFLSSGGFSGLFNGGSRQVALGQLPGHFKTGVLGKKNVNYVQNTELSNLITASMTLELHVVSSKTGAVLLSVSFFQKGAGFSNTDASKIAEENIMKEIETQLPKIVDQLGD